MPSTRRIPLRLYVVAAVLGVALPLLIGAIVLAVYGARQQQQAVETGIANFSDAMAFAMQNHVGATMAALRVLARSPNLASGNLAAFHREAVQAVETQAWYGIALGDREGRQVVSTLRPPGTALPALNDRPFFNEVLATRGAVTSDLLVTRTTRGHQVVVAVPVIHDGEVTHVLFGAFRPEALSAMLKDALQAGGYANALASIVDRNHVVIARTVDAASFVGHKGSASYRDLISKHERGVERTTTLDGRDVYSGFRRIPDTGWTLGFAVPSSLVEAPVRTVVLASGIGVAVLAFAAILIGILFGREVTSIVAAAAESGRDVSQGRMPALRDSRVKEAARLNEALREAASLINTERTELQRADAEAREARAEAETANRAKDVFLAMLAHELRNPLAAVRTAVDLLGLPNADPKTRELARTIIARQTEHLSRMTDDLLDVGRAISGKTELHPRLVNLGQIAQDTVMAMHERLSRHRVGTRLEAAWVRADPTRLTQVVTNVLTNAARYTPEGKAIFIETGEEGGEARLTVRDEGRGMTPDLTGRVFDLFVQGEAGTSQGGLGIGLTLVKRLVELHGGRVTAASAGPGQGSEFTIRLPLVAAPASAEAANDGGEVAPPPAGREVLLVEDNDDARESMQRLLELMGHRVVSASDGLQGLREALARCPEVALLDLSLPGLNGYEIARRIRAEAECRSFLIALTGYGSAETKQKAIDAGFDAHLTKPVDPVMLNDLLNATAHPSR